MIRKTAIITITVVVVLLLFYIVSLISGVLIHFALAILFTSAVRPIVDKVNARKVNRILAILVVYLAVFLVLLIIGLLIIPPFFAQLKALVVALPDFLTSVQLWLNSVSVFFAGLTDLNIADAFSQILSQAPMLAGGLLRVTRNAVSLLFSIALILVVGFYWLYYYETIRLTLSKAMPPQKRKRINEVWEEIDQRLGAYVRGQIMLGGIVGLMSFIGLQVLGIPFSVVLAIFAATTELIPMVGPYIGAVPAVAVALTISPLTAVSVMLLYLFVQQFENHVLVPNVMRLAVGLNPLLILFSLLVGGSLLGIVGAILAVPFAAVTQVLAGYYLEEMDKANIPDISEPPV